MPTITPGHGRSEFTGSLNNRKASSRGMPQVELGTRTTGMALKYPSITASQPPTSVKPQSEENNNRKNLISGKYN